MQESLQRRITEQLGEDAARIRLHVLETVTSTNDALRAAAENGAPEYTVYLAQHQTAGKGRQGRAFFSPAQTGLYASFLFRPQMASEQTLAMTPMAAVAAATAIEACTVQPIQIKWVNDLLLRGKKVCGILAEAKYTSQQTPEYVIVGIGINLITPPEGFPAELREIAGAVFPADTDPRKAFTDCAAELISAMLLEYKQLPEKHYLTGYRERLCVLNRPITVNENGAEHPATALAVDDDLRLLVRYADGTEQWRSTGEIRIRIS